MKEYFKEMWGPLVFAAFAIVAIFYACYRWMPWQKDETSAVLHEEATVVETIHTPASHEMQLRPKLAPGFGIDIGSGLEIHVNDVPETFGVMFRCQHGEFVVNRKELYDKLSAHKGKRVVVSYREVYRTTYKGRFDRPHHVSRALLKYDFLDAHLK